MANNSGTRVFLDINPSPSSSKNIMKYALTGALKKCP